MVPSDTGASPRAAQVNPSARGIPKLRVGRAALAPQGRSAVGRRLPSRGDMAGSPNPDIDHWSADRAPWARRGSKRPRCSFSRSREKSRSTRSLQPIEVLGTAARRSRLTAGKTWVTYVVLMFSQVQHKLLDGALTGLLAGDLYAYLADPRRPIPTLAVRPDSYLA